MKIRYYISGHGLGHASRSCQIIQALRRRHPHLPVEVVSDAAPWFLAGALPPEVPVRRQQTDIGVLQGDSLEMRLGETLAACRRLLENQDALVQSEAASLVSEGVSLVAADLPALPFLAASRAGVPAVGIGNFTWDWIYAGFAAEYPDFAEVAAAFADAYDRGTCLLRLPFHPPESPFRKVVDLPLVARRACLSRDEVRELLGLKVDERLGLVSFGGFGLAQLDAAQLGRLPGWVFVAEGPGGLGAERLRGIPGGRLAYPDLVAAADAVITKPGYGIVSECIAGGTPVLYARRGEFREQPLLIEGLARHVPVKEIGGDALRRGDWGEALDSLLAEGRPECRPATDGDRGAADRLARMASGVV